MINRIIQNVNGEKIMWEYRIKKINHLIWLDERDMNLVANELNKQSSEGWDLVSTDLKQ